jgi:hypothetical protein
MQTVKQFVKRSGFIVGLIRAIRASMLDVKQLYWRAIRGGKIRAYFDAHPSRKLHIGASRSLLPGWLNTDVVHKDPGGIHFGDSRANLSFMLKGDITMYVLIAKLGATADSGQGTFEPARKLSSENARFASGLSSQSSRLALSNLCYVIGVRK